MSIKHPIDTRLRFYVLPAMLTVIGLLVVASWQHSMALIKQYNFEIATAGARNVFEMSVLVRQWNAEHGGVYVFKSAQTPPNVYLQHPQRDLVLVDGRELTMLNPAYMTRQIAELAAKSDQMHLRIHLTSAQPIRPDNRPDAWEAIALTEFASGRREKTGIEEIDGQAYLRYMAPLMVKQECLQCHAKQGYQVGNLRGGLSVGVKYAPIQQTIDEQITASLITHSIFYAVLIVISWALIELLARRWRALDDTIIALQNARDELVESEKIASLGRLVAGFSHELNTPVGITVGAISYSNGRLDDLAALLQQDEVAEHALNAIITDLRDSHQLALANSRRAADLVHRFKRTSIDRSSSEKRLYQLSELIQDVLMTLNNALKHCPVRVDVNCPEAIRLYGTPGLLEQVLTNLITNSLAHGFDNGKKGGVIKIDARKTGNGRIAIIYQDNGAGMSESVRQQAFEPFFTTNRNRGGSGLGLFVTYNIVTRQLHGNIRLASTPDGGARFDIDFLDEAATDTPQETP